MQVGVYATKVSFSDQRGVTNLPLRIGLRTRTKLAWGQARNLSLTRMKQLLVCLSVVELEEAYTLG